MYANIVLPLALEPLTYKIPADIQSSLYVGNAVRVPLRNKSYVGFVTEILSTEEQITAQQLNLTKIKDIAAIDQESPSFTTEYLNFLSWIAKYYHYPLGEVIRCALPPKAKRRFLTTYRLEQKSYNLSESEEQAFAKRGGKRLALIELLKSKQILTEIPEEYKHAARSLLNEEYIQQVKTAIPFTFLEPVQFPNLKTNVILNEEQAIHYEQIQLAIQNKKSAAFLLKGVTGSGKTEVYLSAARYALDNGLGVIILVPEISLTPQLLARFQARLGKQIAILHSELSDYQRLEQWNLINSGTAKIVLGARSTIFAPIQNLGLIIVDEEHDTSFKQEDRLRYNARDMALLRAQLCNATVVLGSATPSLESFYLAQTGKATQLDLTARFAGISLPTIEIIDIRNKPKDQILSGRLQIKIKENLENNKQAILFLNRRGFASFYTCLACGHVPKCPNCSVSLTFYKSKNALQCHYCGFTEIDTNKCQDCGSTNITYGSPGTESLEKEVRTTFPEAKVIRIDRDIITKHTQLETYLKQIANGDIDIIIGTQMIAKGHDFPSVDLVAIIDADVGFNIPDFRSVERSFQIYTQVAGRAGRKSGEGKVFLQTYSPDNPCLQLIKNNDYETFARQELKRRQDFSYPPFVRFARLLITAAAKEEAKKTANLLKNELQQNLPQEIEMLGPSPAILEKIKNKYRWNILLKSTKATAINALIRTYFPYWRQKLPKTVQLQVDIDPVSLY